MSLTIPLPGLELTAVTVHPDIRHDPAGRHVRGEDEKLPAKMPKTLKEEVQQRAGKILDDQKKSAPKVGGRDEPKRGPSL